MSITKNVSASRFSAALQDGASTESTGGLDRGDYHLGNDSACMAQPALNSIPSLIVVHRDTPQVSHTRLQSHTSPETLPTLLLETSA